MDKEIKTKINAVAFHTRLIRDMYMDFSEKIQERFGFFDGQEDEEMDDITELGNSIYDSLNKIKRFTEELRDLTNK